MKLLSRIDMFSGLGLSTCLLVECECGPGHASKHHCKEADADDIGVDTVRSFLVILSSCDGGKIGLSLAKKIRQASDFAIKGVQQEGDTPVGKQNGLLWRACRSMWASDNFFGQPENVSNTFALTPWKRIGVSLQVTV